MTPKTIKSYSNNFLLLLLVTAFLAMHGTPTHIHLSEQHNHDGNQHQHLAESHAHNLIDQAIAIELSQQVSHANVIDLVNQASFPQQQKQSSPPIALISKTAIPIHSLLLVSLSIPAATTTKLSYFELSTVNPRAPPHIS